MMDKLRQEWWSWWSSDVPVLVQKLRDSETKDRQMQAEIDRYESALRVLVGRAPDKTGCSNFTGSSTCRDALSGRTRDSRWGGEMWCESCVAFDALTGGSNV